MSAENAVRESVAIVAAFVTKVPSQLENFGDDGDDGYVYP